MTRLLALGGAALAAVTLTVVVVRAQEASSTPAAEQAELAERQAEAAREAAEQAVRQAEQAAEQARERAQAMADEAQAAAERAAEDATRVVEESADVLVAAPVPVGVGGPFAEIADVFVPGGPQRVEMFMHGPKWERRAADPETMQMMNLDRKVSGQIAELVAKYKSLDDDDERRAVAQEVQARVADQFTVRQSLREKELADLEAQVERLRGLHDKRNEQKDRIIEDRVQQTLRDAEGLGWGEVGGEAGAPGWGAVGIGGDGPGEFNIKFDGKPGVAPLIEGELPRAKRIFLRGGAAAGLPVPPLPGKPPAPAKEPVPTPRK